MAYSRELQQKPWEIWTSSSGQNMIKVLEIYVEPFSIFICLPKTIKKKQLTSLYQTVGQTPMPEQYQILTMKSIITSTFVFKNKEKYHHKYEQI